MNTKAKIVSCVVIACLSVFCILKYNDMKEQETRNHEVVLLYEESNPIDHPTVKGAAFFAREVEKRSNGEIKIIISPAIDDDVRIHENFRNKKCDIARLPINILAEEKDTVLSVLSLPYLFHDNTHKWEVLGSDIGEAAIEEIEAKEICFLSWYEGGERHTINKIKPVRTVDDMKGMRFRVQDSGIMMRVTSNLSQTPAITCSLDLLPTYFQNNQIDGAENDWATYGMRNLYEVAKFISDTGHINQIFVQMIQPDIMRNLSPEHQKIIKECAEQSAIYERESYEKYEDLGRKIAMENGAVYTKIDDIAKHDFEEKVASIAYQLYRDREINIIKRIKEM